MADEANEKDEFFGDDEMIESHVDASAEIPADKDSVPDFSSLETQAMERRKRYSRISQLFDRPLIFLNVHVRPKRFRDNDGYECFVCASTMDDDKRHLFRTCSNVIARQFADVYSVLYSRRASRRRPFSIEKPFRGKIVEDGKGVNQDGKIMAFYRITTSLDENKEVAAE